MKITCALCNKPVDRIFVRYDNYYMGYLVHVECHGEVDQCRIPDCLLEELGQDQFKEGVAFRPETIDATAHPQLL